MTQRPLLTEHYAWAVDTQTDMGLLRMSPLDTPGLSGYRVAMFKSYREASDACDDPEMRRLYPKARPVKAMVAMWKYVPGAVRHRRAEEAAAYSEPDGLNGATR